MLYLVLSLLASKISATSYCNDESECESTTISDTLVYCYGYNACRYSIITSSSTTYCYGYRGCYDATITSRAAYCDGDYGAYYANSITSTYSIGCYGERSCYRIAQMTSGSDIYCQGYFACYYSVLSVSDDVFCDGDYGCYRSTMSLADSLYADGELGAYGITATFTGSHPRAYSYGDYGTAYADLYFPNDATSTIYYYSRGHLSSYVALVYSGENNNFVMYIEGYYTASYSDIYCESGSTCTIYCGTGTRACHGAYLYCTSNSTCNQYCDGDYCMTVSTYTGTIDEKNELIKQRKLLKTKLSETIDENAEPLLINSKRQITIKTDDIPNISKEDREEIEAHIIEVKQNKRNKEAAFIKQKESELDNVINENNNQQKSKNSHLTSILIISCVLIGLFLLWKYQNKNSGKTLDTEYSPLVSNSQYQSV